MTTITRPVSTVQRAVAVLAALADSAEDLGNNEIARRTGVNPSTVSRLLSTLADADLVLRTSENGRFRLGPRLVELGNAALARVDLRQLGRPHLMALTAGTGETSTLSIPTGESTITVDFVQSPSSVRSVAEVGRPSVTHATATGKVFLAYAGPMPAGPLVAYTPHTITDTQRLIDEIQRSRHRGWAQAVGEREADLNALAAPVLDSGGGLVAVLGLQGPAGRFSIQAMHAAVAQLLDRSQLLSAATGR